MSSGPPSVRVQKFGGTSVGTPERIRSVAAGIAQFKNSSSTGLVVVVSAMGQTTDELLTLAQAVSQDPSSREMDMLLTAGERISMALLSMALKDLGIAAISLTGSQSGIITDGAHRRARIQNVIGARIREGLARNQVVIVAGFQGVSTQKEITTLGRGGSDTTAVALAAALGADRCEIFTDVDGVYSADPRIAPKARLWPQLTHDVMVELATRGAGVLHPRSVELAKAYGVPLFVRNSLRNSLQHARSSSIHPDAVSLGTQIVTPPEVSMHSISTVHEEPQFRGVTADRDKFSLRVTLARSGTIQAVWDFSAKAHLQVIAPAVMGEQLQFFTEREAVGEWRKQLERLVADGFVREYRLEEDLVPLTLVGEKFSQDGTVLAKVADLLSRAGVPTLYCTGSALAITVAIPQTHMAEGIEVLHREFFERNLGEQQDS